jgi:hypothetical protein
MAKHQGTVGRKQEFCRRNSLIERPLVKGTNCRSAQFRRNDAHIGSRKAKL